MTDALIREAAVRGVDLYITGQLRQPAAAAVEETGIRVIVVGHRRSEDWGLRSLAGVLRDRYFNLEVVLPPVG
jgi:putative NIF3 family GTP cyclohydrolase 1 type 2